MSLKDILEHRVGQKSNGEVRVAFRCPQCQDAGTVEWRKLDRQMRCHSCGCEFQIDKNEVRPVSGQAGRRVRFTCPRCKHTGSVLQAVALRGIRCVECDYSLSMGPDNQLHSAEELQKLEQRFAEAAKPGRLANCLDRISTSRFATLMESWLKWPIVAVFLLAAVFVFGAVGDLFSSLTGSNLPTALARNFAYACLDRNPEAPLSFIGEDPLQNVEFRRWKIYHFASIGDHVRPQNDSVKVTVEVEEETEDTQVLTVRLKSDHIGERSHKQHWRRENGQWLFDAVSTLGGTTQNTSVATSADAARK